MNAVPSQANAALPSNARVPRVRREHPGDDADPFELLQERFERATRNTYTRRPRFSETWN